jgi:hypothetical protein
MIKAKELPEGGCEDVYISGWWSVADIDINCVGPSDMLLVIGYLFAKLKAERDALQVM